jgi:prepilin-type processing-associated H-X9-DG protein
MVSARSPTALQPWGLAWLAQICTVPGAPETVPWFRTVTVALNVLFADGSSGVQGYASHHEIGG